MMLILNRFLLLLVFVVLVGSLETTGAEKEQPLKIWFQQPTLKWNEGLPVRNGSLGAMI